MLSSPLHMMLLGRFIDLSLGGAGPWSFPLNQMWPSLTKVWTPMSLRSGVYRWVWKSFIITLKPLHHNELALTSMRFIISFKWTLVTVFRSDFAETKPSLHLSLFILNSFIFHYVLYSCLTQRQDNERCALSLEHCLRNFTTFALLGERAKCLWTGFVFDAGMWLLYCSGRTKELNSVDIYVSLTFIGYWSTHPDTRTVTGNVKPPVCLLTFCKTH